MNSAWDLLDELFEDKGQRPTELSSPSSVVAPPPVAPPRPPQPKPPQPQPTLSKEQILEEFRYPNPNIEEFVLSFASKDEIEFTYITKDFNMLLDFSHFQHQLAYEFAGQYWEKRFGGRLPLEYSHPLRNTISAYIYKLPGEKLLKWQTMYAHKYLQVNQVKHSMTGRIVNAANPEEVNNAVKELNLDDIKSYTKKEIMKIRNYENNTDAYKINLALELAYRYLKDKFPGKENNNTYFGLVLHYTKAVALGLE